MRPPLKADLLEEDQLDAMGLKAYPGYIGVYTRFNAPGAMPAGTRIQKALDEPGDSHIVGDAGIVLGSIAIPDVPELREKFGERFSPFMYFIEWDDTPKHAVAIVSNKIKEAT